MSSALSIALSSLQAQSEAIDTTGNNLANMNTTGFKGSMVDFEDLMSQYMGVGSGLAMGTGVARPINQQLFTQGPTEISSSPLATAIQGNGFFVVSDPSSGAQEFTRDGNFTISNNGELQTQTGENVQGWTASANGTLNTSVAPSNIVLPAGTILPPQVTQNFSLSANLNSNATTAGDPPFSYPISVVDSLGQTHQLSMTFTQSASNSWNYQVSIPGSDLLSGIAAQPTGTTTVGSATVTGLSSATGIAVGQTVGGTGIPSGTTVTAISGTTVTLSSSVIAPGGGATALTFTAPAGGQVPLLASPGGTLTFNQDGTLASSNPNSVALSVSNLADGANNLSMNWDLRDSSANPLITQYAQTSAVSSTQNDGTVAAQLTSVSIQSGGQVVASFSNNQQKVLGQLALASIQNTDSLVNMGNNNFAATASTAAPTIGLPQSGGRGQILGGQLEGSNVDMATEFTNLITFQSGYQASARVITTVNTITQDLMNLIR